MDEILALFSLLVAALISFSMVISHFAKQRASRERVEFYFSEFGEERYFEKGGSRVEKQKLFEVSGLPTSLLNLRVYDYQSNKGVRTEIDHWLLYLRNIDENRYR